MFATPFRLAGGVVLTSRGAFDTGDTGLEERLLSGGAHDLRERDSWVFEDIRALREHLLVPWPPVHWAVVNPCECAPLYEPQWWNQPAFQPSNNCYNYGSNYRTNTFAQPGRKAGAMYPTITGAAVRAAAVADQLIDSPGADNHCPGEGHLVALVIAPGADFHWYRKGRDGFWTHKPGGTQVTNRDNAGNLIADPRTAARGMYTEFTTFMTVMHGHIAIA